MRKHNIEKDLLKIFKTKKEQDIIYIILEMVNGTYDYELAYMNQISYNEMILRLIKVIDLCLKEQIDLDNPYTILSHLEQFSSKVKYMTYEELEKISFLKIKYDTLIKMEQLKTGKNIKKIIFKVSLTTILFLSIYGKLYNINTSRDLENKESNISSEDVEIDNDTNYQMLKDDSIEKKLNIEINDLIEKNSELKEIQPVIEKSSFTDNSSIVETEPEISPDEIVDEEAPNDLLLEDSNFEEENNDEENNEYPYYSKEDKINKIINNYNLTRDEFDVVCAIVTAEAKANSYEDAYAVINTIYNRTKSYSFVNSYGQSLYSQATAPSQFVVYDRGLYYDFLGFNDGPVLDAIFDFLITKEKMHNYLAFRSAGKNPENSIQFTENGNKYFEILEDDDRILEEDTLQR